MGIPKSYLAHRSGEKNQTECAQVDVSIAVRIHVRHQSYATLSDDRVNVTICKMALSLRQTHSLRCRFLLQKVIPTLPYIDSQGIEV